MASLSLGESKWRMVRRVLKKKTFTYQDARNMGRADQAHFDWLVANGFFAAAGDERYVVTDRGREGAELGMYELAPAHAS